MCDGNRKTKTTKNNLEDKMQMGSAYVQDGKSLMCHTSTAIDLFLTMAAIV